MYNNIDKDEVLEVVKGFKDVDSFKKLYKKINELILNDDVEGMVKVFGFLSVKILADRGVDIDVVDILPLIGLGSLSADDCLKVATYYIVDEEERAEKWFGDVSVIESLNYFMFKIEESGEERYFDGFYKEL